MRLLSSHLWQQWGSRCLQDIRPQVLPFEEYGRRYTYPIELAASVRPVHIDGVDCRGIDNPTRRGANFHAWENDLQVGFGARHYADRWEDPALREVADGILRLSLLAPRRQGAFPCVYNFDEGRYEGTLYWTARAADFRNGFDTAAMGVSAWWRLHWYELLDPRPEILASVLEYARFLQARQLASGAIPTYFGPDLRPFPGAGGERDHGIERRGDGAGGCARTCGRAAERAAGVAGRATDSNLREAALAAGRWVAEHVLPELRFDDFESFYSCSPKPLYAVDYWSGIRPQCNLSIQWTADQMLALYRLTGDSEWLARGEYALGLLSLYQQVWDPPHRSGYLFGGFGVLNTDGEWNDGRQARFVPSYADYYAETGTVEYLQRAVAACRASFALMDIRENHENGINSCVVGTTLDARRAAHGAARPGQGYAGENIHHGGTDAPDSSWTGMTWSAGGGLAASAYLERRFGGVWVDHARRIVVPIDGVRADLLTCDEDRIEVSVRSALDRLPAPYRGVRAIVLKVGTDVERGVRLTVNGATLEALTREELRRGVTIQLGE